MFEMVRAGHRIEQQCPCFPLFNQIWCWCDLEILSGTFVLDLLCRNEYEHHSTDLLGDVLPCVNSSPPESVSIFTKQPLFGVE